jgi:hypothetical protein
MKVITRGGLGALRSGKKSTRLIFKISGLDWLLNKRTTSSAKLIMRKYRVGVDNNLMNSTGFVIATGLVLKRKRRITRSYRIAFWRQKKGNNN